MPRGKKTTPELKAECLRLRIEERLSLREIHARTGVSKGSLSPWLRDHPLTEEEKAQKQKENARYGAPKKDRGAESDFHRRYPPEKMTRIQKGKLAEVAVLFRLTLEGFGVYSSAFDGDKFDWIAGLPGEPLIKIQVKWARSGRTGLPAAPLMCHHGYYDLKRYEKGDFDFFVAYDFFTDTCYVWSWDELAGLKSSVTICPEAAEAWHKLKGDRRCTGR